MRVLFVIVSVLLWIVYFICLGRVCFRYGEFML